ncbi:MAG: dethiobiotin synthase, partial [Bacteroidota bacterium]|nr:dethiobiotin synthase [Bacteroidota bacterium]
LGSINHSLLTAMACKQYNLPVIGWIFNDQYLQYEHEIVNWSGFPSIGSIPFTKQPNKTFVQIEATKIKQRLLDLL